MAQYRGAVYNLIIIVYRRDAHADPRHPPPNDRFRREAITVRRLLGGNESRRVKREEKSINPKRTAVPPPFFFRIFCVNSPIRSDIVLSSTFRIIPRRPHRRRPETLWTIRNTLCLCSSWPVFGSFISKNRIA